MEKKNVVIFVAGQRFSIATGDTEEYVTDIGRKVDVMIKGIAKDNPRLNRDACAILTALNFCDDETKLRQMMEVLREQVKDYINSNEALRAENTKLKEELKALKNATAETAKEEPVKEETLGESAQQPDVVSTTSTTLPTKSEAIVAAEAQTRHTAFVGKNFGGKNKKNKHKHQKQYQAPSAPSPAVASSAPADIDEAQAEAVSPYHQFSIFDDLP